MAQKIARWSHKKVLSANSELIGWVVFGALIISIYQFSSRFGVMLLNGEFAEWCNKLLPSLQDFITLTLRRNCRGGPILNFRNYHIRAYQILFIIKRRFQNIAKKRLSSTNCALYDRANFTRVRMW